ncbi:MAG: cupin domain-containing protein [Candidatus Nanohaloarchaea archaeon]
MEAYRFPEGVISIAACDAEQCIGTLTLHPEESLERHNRPVDEQLLQLHGTSEMELYSGDELEETVELTPGDTLTIPAGKYHAHTNPGGERSVTVWRFDGDIRGIIEDIREDNEPL